MSVDQTASRTRAVIVALIEAADGVNAHNKIVRSNPRGKTIDLPVANVRRVRIVRHGLSAMITNHAKTGHAKTGHVKIVRARIVRLARLSNGVIVNGRMIDPTTNGPTIAIVAHNAAIATRPQAKYQPALPTMCQPSCVRPRGPKPRTNRPAL